MATYRVTVEFSGTSCYDISLDDDVDPTKAIDDLIYDYGSLDNVTNRRDDRIDESIVSIEKLEK